MIADKFLSFFSCHLNVQTFFPVLLLRLNMSETETGDCAERASVEDLKLHSNLRETCHSTKPL